MIESEIHIATLANRHGLTLRALRFYEQQGLLSPKREGRKRIYSDKDEARLVLIIAAKSLGFAISEIHGLIHQGPDGREHLIIPKDIAQQQLVVMFDRYREVADAVDRLRAIAGEKAA